MKIAILLACVTALFCLGCVNVDAKAPERISWGGGTLYDSGPPPASEISQADRDDKDALQRENTQLRERLTWVQNRNRELSREYEQLGREIQQLHRDIADAEGK